MGTVLVALTSLDPTAERVLDALGAEYPVSAWRGSRDTWIVEVDRPVDDDPERAAQEVRFALSEIEPTWSSLLTIGALPDG
jgi:hypothetical protein